MYEKYLKAAAEIRKLTIRAMEAAGYGHIGGSMSIADLLAVLYSGVMNIDPKNPKKADRDYLVLSKGHCGPALYAALAYAGYFDRKELLTLNANGTRLPSHADRLKTPGVDLSTGSLGQGVSLGIGAALGNRMQGINSYTYIIVGDGETQEGQVWEGVQFMAHHKLDKVIMFIDKNKRQLDGMTEDICANFDLVEKFKAFGAESFEINGHSVKEICQAIEKAKEGKRPAVIVLNTEKGHGCNFAEIKGFNHYMVITHEMAEGAVKEIDRRLESALCTEC
jgi:transketolase